MGQIQPMIGPIKWCWLWSNFGWPLLAGLGFRFLFLIWGKEMGTLRDADLPALRFRRTQLLKCESWAHSLCLTAAHTADLSFLLLGESKFCHSFAFYFNFFSPQGDEGPLGPPGVPGPEVGFSHLLSYYQLCWPCNGIVVNTKLQTSRFGEWSALLRNIVFSRAWSNCLIQDGWKSRKCLAQGVEWDSNFITCLKSQTLKNPLMFKEFILKTKHADWKPSFVTSPDVSSLIYSIFQWLEGKVRKKTRQC